MNQNKLEKIFYSFKHRINRHLLVFVKQAIMRSSFKRDNKIFLVIANRKLNYEDYFHTTKHFAYAQLGMLSTTFAEIEERIHDILLDLVQNDNMLLGYFLERNTLSKNIKLVEKICKAELFEVDRLKSIVKRLEEARTVRNSLIHGAWMIFPNKEREKTIIKVCTNEIKANVLKDDTIFENKTYKEFSIEEIQCHVKEAFSIFLEIEEFHSLLLGRNLRS